MRRQGTGRAIHIKKDVLGRQGAHGPQNPQGHTSITGNQTASVWLHGPAFCLGELGSPVLIQGQTLVPFGLWEKFQSRPQDSTTLGLSFLWKIQGTGEQRSQGLLPVSHPPPCRL